MTIEQAIKYAKDANYCLGCSKDFSLMSGEDARDICNHCEHRQFFDLVIEELGKHIPKVRLKTSAEMLRELTVQSDGSSRRAIEALEVPKPKRPRAKECRCWCKYPNSTRLKKCALYECVFEGDEHTKKTICKLKEDKT